MTYLKYISDVSTLDLNEEICTGCRKCLDVCPHEVFGIKEKKAYVIDKDNCMECGACALNCPVSAISVVPGTGCASLIIQNWLREKNINIGSGKACC